ncbi:MAG: PIG-L family deacetylase [Nitrospiraceae bacterium]|nr:PIG-L family deacetylase [Nitrospiraceae bacterium]
MKPSARIKWRHVSRLYERLAPLLKASPLKMDRPESGRVLVLAPHIDDDVIGAGGCLRKHVLAGDYVKVVYLADCSEARIAEAEEAADVIGFVNLEFLGYDSKRLLQNTEIPSRLDGIIRDAAPDFVYLPSLFDRHNDHLAVNHHLAALQKKHDYAFTVCAYEVWTALVPNLVVDITDTVGAKKEALTRYGSQLASNDWLDAAISLNRYRGVTSGAGAYAEGFMRYSAGEYYALWKAVYGK